LSPYEASHRATARIVEIAVVLGHRRLPWPEDRQRHDAASICFCAMLASILAGDATRRENSMPQKTLLRPEGLVQSPAFTHVAVVPPGATTVYIGGQNSVDGDGTLVGGDDVAAQTQQVMANLHVALAAAGAGAQDLVMMTILLVEGVDLAAAYPVAAAALEGAAPPVVAAFVAGLGVPGALLEVSAIAAVM
jgi:enamine deaminase RidA (YjgF/YER057c/UK114 family)